MNTQSLRIGELARVSGVKVVTIRYYESVGLMPVAARTSGNYRFYGEEARQRLQFIRRCRDLGFKLTQVRELLWLSSDKMMPCGQVKRIAAQHEKTVEAKLKDLQRLLKELHRLSTCCNGKCVIRDCSIIEALSAGRPARAGIQPAGRR
jgi:DNA-binding transcriptional MerR regulator